MIGDRLAVLKERTSELAAIAFAAFVHLLFLALIILGVLIVNAMFWAWRTGQAGPVEAVGVAFMGLLMALIGAGFFYIAYVGAPRFLAGLQRKRLKYQNRPWLIKPAWRARRVVHSTKYTAWFMWFWCALWWGLIGLLWSVNKELIIAALNGPWSEAIPTAIPFVAGGIGLVVALSLSWQRFRYGDAVLLINTLPGYLGERFRGKVEAYMADRPYDRVIIELTCGRLTSRRDMTASGEHQTTWITDELWTRSNELHPAQMTYDKHRATLPVEFDLPIDLPESGHILDDPQIIWKLKVKPVSVIDRGLTSEFEVPIFTRRDDSA